MSSLIYKSVIAEVEVNEIQVVKVNDVRGMLPSDHRIILISSCNEI